MSRRINQNSPSLQTAYFGVELLWLLSQPAPLPSMLLPCASGPGLPCPRQTPCHHRGTDAGAPREAGEALLSLEMGHALVLFVPQRPLIVGCSGSRLPHDSLADVLSLNK